MATVVVTATTERNLRSLIESHSLPASAAERVWASVEPLRDFPSLGAPLGGRWAGYRFLLGPWRWMLIVYRYDERLSRVQVMTIRDARSERSPTRSRLIPARAGQSTWDRLVTEGKLTPPLDPAPGLPSARPAVKGLTATEALLAERQEDVR